MPCPGPHHPNAVFSLCPANGNELAKIAISSPENAHLVSKMPDSTLAIDVGFYTHGNPLNTLATLGRGTDASIYIGGSDIAKIQCSFEADLDTGVIMSYDRSHTNTTQVFGESATQFELNRIRQVLVQNDLNTTIGMGGMGCNLLMFKIRWHVNPEQMAEIIKDYKVNFSARVENPRLARTTDLGLSGPSSPRETGPHTLGTPRLKMRYKKVGDELGSGSFGVVYKAIDVDSGKLMAVKILKQPTGTAKKSEWDHMKYYAEHREVNVLSRTSHANVIEYFASQGWEGPKVEIFMALKDETLGSLVRSVADTTTISMTVFPQILGALDYLACKKIIHRDVKPENILYTSQPGGQYQFQLGDFGLCNYLGNAKSILGTPLFMAPEMYRGETQTSKVDVWSLLVTMIWVLDLGKIRDCHLQSRRDILNEVLSAFTKHKSMAKIQDMGKIDPEVRASAAQMLVKNYNGFGLSTPRTEIPPLPNISAPSADSSGEIL